MRCKILMELLFCTVVLFVLESFLLFVRKTKKTHVLQIHLKRGCIIFQWISSLSGEKSKHFSALLRKGNCQGRGAAYVCKE